MNVSSVTHIELNILIPNFIPMSRFVPLCKMTQKPENLFLAFRIFLPNQATKAMKYVSSKLVPGFAPCCIALHDLPQVHVHAIAHHQQNIIIKKATHSNSQHAANSLQAADIL